MSTTTPAGWYPDPSGGPNQRWWDGAQWTDQLSSPYAPAETLKAPEGTVTNTVWIWLIVVLPLLPLLGLLTIPWGSLFDIASLDPTDSSQLLAAELGIFLSPGYIGSIVGSWLVYGLNAFFAYRDWRFLQRAGVPKPFHFAWVFLSSIVYTIGRAVVVKRRTGSGSAVLWASIAAIVLMIIITIVMSAQMMSAMLSQIPTDFS